MSKTNFTQKQKIAIIKGVKKTTIRYAAKVAGIHYTTIYDWRRQLAAMGEEAFLVYQVSKPGRGIKQISPEKEEAVLKEWNNNPGFGPGQIRNQLRRQRVTISTTSVRKILQANGYKVIKKKPKSESDHRFEASRPFELTQMDILEFYINKLKVYIIILLDDYSRFILGWNLLEKTSMDEVIKVVQDAISRYGKMEELLTDLGFVFYSWHGINRFEKYLEMIRIDHTHASAHHPKTLGKVEACNKNIKHELLRQHYFLTVQEARPEKTVITYIKNGFTFLGQTFRKHGRKLHITPSIKGVLALKQKVGTLIRKYVSAPMPFLIKKLNQTLVGWANYHRHVVASEAFSRIDT
jgi:transposase